jgi:hypothetical protein
MRCHQSGRRKKQNPDSESKHSADGRSPKRNDVLQVLRSSAELSAVYAIVRTKNLELEELVKRSSLDIYDIYHRDRRLTLV